MPLVSDMWQHELQDVKGYVYEFCRDQHGSRYLQQKLAEGSPEELMLLYEELRPHVIALMQDVFGNYVIQKLFEHGNQVSLTCNPFTTAVLKSRLFIKMGPTFHICCQHQNIDRSFRTI